MGFKRPFDGEELHGLTFKQSRAPCSDKLSHFSENISFSVLRKSDIDAEETIVESLEILKESEQNKDVTKIADIGVDLNTSLPVISCNSPEKNFSPVNKTPFSEINAQDVFLRISIPSNDVCISYMSHTPRKQVPVGPEYQVVLPCCKIDPEMRQNSANDCSKCKIKDELVGTCVISMPNSDTSEIGVGRKDCSCPDRNSIRCVRQHIMEARENVRRSIGHEKFVDLGFYEMGEEVACHWSEEDERIFHGVVYANPASLGYNLWQHLFEVFPSRSKKEIVSFYFNVFMLRRRASQNRSNFLDIDSDDDEWHGVNKNIIKSCRNDCIVDDVENFSDIITEDEKGIDDEATSVDSDGDNGDIVDANEIVFRATEPVVSNEIECPETRKESTIAEFSVQEDSCMSFEFSTDKVCTSNTFQVNRNESNGDHQVFLLDSCDSKLWDAECSGSRKGVDLLPTCNMIEEIFGQGNCSRDL